MTVVTHPALDALATLQDPLIEMFGGLDALYKILNDNGALGMSSALLERARLSRATCGLVFDICDGRTDIHPDKIEDFLCDRHYKINNPFEVIRFAVHRSSPRDAHTLLFGRHGLVELLTVIMQSGSSNHEARSMAESLIETANQAIRPVLERDDLRAGLMWYVKNKIKRPVESAKPSNQQLHQQLSAIRRHLDAIVDNTNLLLHNLRTSGIEIMLPLESEIKDLFRHVTHITQGGCGNTSLVERYKRRKEGHDFIDFIRIDPDASLRLEAISAIGRAPQLLAAYSRQLDKEFSLIEQEKAHAQDGGDSSAHALRGARHYALEITNHIHSALKVVNNPAFRKALEGYENQTPTRPPNTRSA